MGWWPSPIGKQCRKVWAKPWLWLTWPRLLRRLIVFKPLINNTPLSQKPHGTVTYNTYNFYPVKLRNHAQVLEKLRIPLHSTTTCSVLVAIQYMDAMSTSQGLHRGPGPLARAMHGCAHLLPAKGSKVEYSDGWPPFTAPKNKQPKKHLDTNQVLSRVLD